jgi:cytochrome c-type biogenesis protein CcmH/NrfF
LSATLTRRGIATTLLALLLAAPAAASERQPTLAELERELMCPTCEQLLELSHAPVADRIRAFIKTRIAAGDSKSEIKHQLVRQFGESVLAAPPTYGFNLLAWLVPLLGLAGTGVALGALTWRWTRSTMSISPDSTLRNESPDPDLEGRLDYELELLDH